MQHHPGHPEDERGTPEKVEHEPRQEARQPFAVRSQPGHEPPDRFAVIEREGELLQVGERRPAHVVGHPGGDATRHHDEPPHHDPHPGHDTQVLPHAGAHRRGASPVHRLVDDETGHTRQSDVSRSHDDAQDAHGRQPSAVRAGVSQDPPPEHRIDPALELFLV